MDPRDKIKIKPKKKLKIKVNKELDDEDKFNRQAKELRKKVAEKDPSLTTKTRLKPTAPQLRSMKDD